MSEERYKTRRYLPSPEETDQKLFCTENITLPMLQEAYWHGFFPWPEDKESTEIPWVNPQGRGLIPLAVFHIPHTVKRLLKNGLFELRIDTAFEDVLAMCAERNDGSDTWITPEIKKNYAEFHKIGWAHSFEAWSRKNGNLVGGLYGISIGKIFAGESMFYRESGASKFALACLGLVLTECGVQLLDTQMVTPVTEQFGAKYFYRGDYLDALEYLRDTPITTEQLRTAAEKLKSEGKIC